MSLCGLIGLGKKVTSILKVHALGCFLGPGCFLKLVLFVVKR